MSGRRPGQRGAMMEDPGDEPVERRMFRGSNDVGTQDGGNGDSRGERGLGNHDPQTSSSAKPRNTNHRRARQQELSRQNQHDDKSEEDDDDIESDVIPGAHRIGGSGGSSLYASMYTTQSNSMVLSTAEQAPATTRTTTTTPVVAQLATDITELEGENRRLAQKLADITEAEVVVDASRSTRSLLPKRKIYLLIVLIAVLFGAVFGISLGVSSRLRGTEPQIPPSASTATPPNKEADLPSQELASSEPNVTMTPSAFPTYGPVSSSPTHSPTSSPAPSYLQSAIAPPSITPNFDHFNLFGYGAGDESNIDKITQIRVYTTVFCSTLNDCSLPTTTQISLVMTYLLGDCTTSTQRNGAYTDDDRTPAGIVNLRRNQYISMVELFTERHVTHIKICATDSECFGPFGSSLGVEPNVVFEEPGSVIKALYGYSGSWLDGLGVYFEQGFTGSTENPCS